MKQLGEHRLVYGKEDYEHYMGLMATMWVHSACNALWYLDRDRPHDAREQLIGALTSIYDPWGHDREAGAISQKAALGEISIREFLDSLRRKPDPDGQPDITS
jgi:hypothetical protein